MIGSCTSKELRLDSFFDMIYVINMKHRVDKLNNIKLIFEKLNISKYKIIEPVDPSSIQFDANIRQTAISCKRSHLSCYEDAKENMYEKICVFEDDICFNTSDRSIQKNIENHIGVCIFFLKNFNWDLFYFDNIIGLIKKDLKVTNIIRHKCSASSDRKIIHKIDGKSFAHSYALSRNAYEHMIELHYLDRNKYMWNDWILKDCGLDNIFMYLPGIFDQSIGITSDHKWNN